MTKITLREMIERGADEDLMSALNDMIGESVSDRVSKAAPDGLLLALGYYPPCPCGERGIPPWEKLIDDGENGEVCYDCSTLAGAG